MAVQVLIPERKSFMDKVTGAFGQVAQGAQGVSSIKGLFGGGGAGGGAGVGGGAAGGMGLGVGNVTPVTTGMSPTLGGGAVAPATSAGSGGGTAAAMGSSIMGPAAAIGAGYYAQYRIGEANEAKVNKQNERANAEFRASPMSAGTKIDDVYRPSGATPEGLSLTSGNPNKLGAMERRYSNQQTAMQDIQAAQKELVNSGIPEQERVRIGQKLEIARQQMEGRSRGPRSTYS